VRCGNGCCSGGSGDGSRLGRWDGGGDGGRGGGSNRGAELAVWKTVRWWGNGGGGGRLRTGDDSQNWLEDGTADAGETTMVYGVEAEATGTARAEGIWGQLKQRACSEQLVQQTWMGW